MGTELARRLRREPTSPEARLWARLRNRGLHGCKFRRQMPVGRFVADLACVEARLVVEIDGSQHTPDDPREAERTAFIGSAGYLVMRFPNDAVLKRIDDVIEQISEMLLARTETSRDGH